MGFAVGLDAEEYDRIYRDRDLLKRVFAYFNDHQRPMLVVTIFLTLTSLANAISPLLARDAINQLETTKDLGYLLLLILIIFLLKIL